MKGREAIRREIKEINRNIDDDKIAIAIARKQEETNQSMEEEEPSVNEFDNVVEHTENFLKKLSVGFMSRRDSVMIQDKHEPSNIAASAVQELINMRGMQKQRKVTFTEEVDAEVTPAPDVAERYKYLLDNIKDMVEKVRENMENVDWPAVIFISRHVLSGLLLVAGFYMIIRSILF